MKTFHVCDIDWDTSDFSEEEELASGVCVPDLPSECDIDADCEDDIEEVLTKEYGFCVNSFLYEVVCD